MSNLLTRFLAVLSLAVGLSGPVMAQVNPTASSVTEDQLFESLGTAPVVGRVTIPDAAAAYLIKPENKSWAALQAETLHLLVVGPIVAIIVLLALFYLVRGRIRVDSGLSGRTILRFNALERFAHWTLASTFIILALTGLNIVVGRWLILPLIGADAFGTLSAWGKLAHNFLAWPFMIALVLVLLLWAVHNIPNAVDWQWIKQGGGLLKKGVHPPARKFNAGQKLIFWSVILGGAALSFTGIMMLFPAQAGTPADWQLYQTIHALTAAGLTAVIIAHIYIGSVGMEGAFDAMGSGEVDENWAREHHSLWVEEIKGETGAAGHPKAHPAE